MPRVPMGLPATLPAKNGFGIYKSDKIEERYPHIEFSQFTGAEMMAKKYNLTKDELDKYSYESHQRAIAATQRGHPLRSQPPRHQRRKADRRGRPPDGGERQPDLRRRRRRHDRQRKGLE